MKKNRRKNMVLFLFILLCSLGIGYAFLRTELSINGTADFLDARWDIHFNNLVINPDSVELSTGNTAATISASTTEVTYAVTLKEPGDFYEFTVDAVNAGTIDGMIDNISSKMGGVEITTLPAYMEYSVTYSDGLMLVPNQYLKAGETETYKVHIGFKKDINASDLTGQVESKTFSFSVSYVQADENAVEVCSPDDFATDDWSTVVCAAKRGLFDSYNVGDTREIDMGTFGTHTLRIANCSKPAECSTAGFSQTACGVVFEFADIIITRDFNPPGTYKGIQYKWGWNVDGWPASSMRAYIDETIYAALPSELRSVIVPTKVISGHGNTSGETNFESTDKLYLLSTHEVWEDNDGNSNSGIDYYDKAYSYTRQLDYYKNLGVTTSDYSGAIKKRNNKSSDWWLRSARSNTNSFGSVNDGGNWSYYSASYTHGVSPAFRIG